MRGGGRKERQVGTGWVVVVVAGEGLWERRGRGMEWVEGGRRRGCGFGGPIEPLLVISLPPCSLLSFLHLSLTHSESPISSSDFLNFMFLLSYLLFTVASYRCCVCPMIGYAPRGRPSCVGLVRAMNKT